MRTFPVRLILLVLALVAGLGTAPSAVGAQNNQFTDRAYVPSPVVRGMGDAGVALPGIEQGFFYNPAHLPRVASHFTIFGVQGGASRSLKDQIQFYNQELKPAIRSEFDGSTDALASLHREASALGRRPARGQGGILLPSFVYSPGALGVGGGVFAKTALNYRVETGGGGVPSVWLLTRTDLMALASLGLDLRVIGLSGLSVGATATQTRRLLSFKSKPLARFTPEESAVQLEGSTFQLDAGLVYSPPWLDLPGTLRLGGALYDFLEQDYDYAPGSGPGRMPFLGEIVGRTDGDPPPREARQARQAFALEPSYRVGAAYELRSLFFLDDLAFTLDYQGYGNDAQAPLAHVHAGARAHLVGPVRARIGFSAGYPSGGLGLELGVFHLDYALHGVEEGRRPGQLGTYVHTARLLLRLE